MINVAIVGTVGLPACYGGFESLVENLVRHGCKKINYEVFCSKKSYQEHPNEFEGAKLTYIPLSANGIQSILYDILSLIKCFKSKPDIVLILGVSGCLFLPIFKALSKAKIVTNIDGLEWNRDKWGKLTRKFLKLSESFAVKYSDVIIADNQAIGDYVSSEYSTDNQIIPYGGDHALRNVVVEPTSDSYSLGLCRIEPENNVEMILEAFSKTNKKLKFVGNWNKSGYGLKLKEIYCKYKNIELLDPIYDLDNLYQLRSNAKYYIHGHSAGGTNPSLVEMMHFGIPIFAFNCNFNRYSTEDKANYFDEVDDLIMLINNDSDYSENGIKMNEIAIRRYTWREITYRYECAYK